MRKLLAIALILAAQTVWAGDLLPATITTKTGTVPLKLEIASTPETREYGLMNRPSLAPQSGMLFIFPRSQRLYFWMKDTLIPLDILFIDDKGIIQHINANATPHSLTPIDSVKPITTVIEIAGGHAATDHIQEGDKVSYHLPADIHAQ